MAKRQLQHFQIMPLNYSSLCYLALISLFSACILFAVCLVSHRLAEASRIAVRMPCRNCALHSNWACAFALIYQASEETITSLNSWIYAIFFLFSSMVAIADAARAVRFGISLSVLHSSAWQAVETQRHFHLMTFLCTIVSFEKRAHRRRNIFLRKNAFIKCN